MYLLVYIMVMVRLYLHLLSEGSVLATPVQVASLFTCSVYSCFKSLKGPLFIL